MESNRAQQCMLNMSSQIIAIDKEDKLAKPVILISGFLFSLWTFCIFIAGVNPYGFRDTDSMIAIVGLASHVIISLAATKGVYHGIKHYDRVFLTPWLYLKVVEGIFLFTGSILCASNYRSYIGLTILGIILLMCGVYVTMCVYTTYKKMVPPPPPPTINGDVIPEHPPAYDSFTNQKNLA